ncbi:spore germination lipoprotein GerD [Lentibacillus sediminis]|uniref:spore germination lipoprotein GerD n=1 Tax=Lentibacillus sediminis TaxID=1940529 RepID=UPI000C1BA77C|nr:spore germination lipoprotein GerD [Lentibacillus sediminis]
MIHLRLLPIFGLLLILMSACAGGNAAQGSEAEYDTTKKMVVDILQTEEGKKAIQDIITNGQLKQELVMESDTVKQAINETLTSDKGTEMWTKLFEDPKFVEGFAKSMSEEQKKLMKDLMKDSEYQQQMIDLLKDPQMTEQLVSVLKSQEFRSHLEETIQQTLETPTFQAKIQEILLKAAEKQGSGQGGGGQQGGGSGSGSGGGGGGAGGGSGGGASGAGQ